MKESAVSLITQLDGRVLAVWNKNRSGWVLPGGKLEPGENPATAQRRELREETGLETLFAVEVFAAPSCTDPDRLVHVFMVAAKGMPAEAEPGCPVMWRSLLDFVQLSPYGPFYDALFKHLGLYLRDGRTP